MGGGKYEIRRTAVFDQWLGRLRDGRAKARILSRIARLEQGAWGDVRSVGDSVFELRIMIGPGYRLYGTVVDGAVVLLLCGGDKGSQERDIERAKRLAKRFRKEGA